MIELQKKLMAVQTELKVLKNNAKNDLKFTWRTTEDILQEAKPLCIREDLLLTISDKIINVGVSNYIESTATVTSGENSLSCTGLAKEPDKLMSMSAPQITGSCSSYARKTALCGLFAIDNNDDPDNEEPPEPPVEASETQIKVLNDYLPLLANVSADKEIHVKNKLACPLTQDEAQYLLDRCAGITGVKK